MFYMVLLLIVLWVIIALRTDDALSTRSRVTQLRSLHADRP